MSKLDRFKVKYTNRVCPVCGLSMGVPDWYKYPPKCVGSIQVPHVPTTMVEEKDLPKP